MPGGLAALLDDVSVIARAAASSVDDVAAFARAENPGVCSRWYAIEYCDNPADDRGTVAENVPLVRVGGRALRASKARMSEWTHAMKYLLSNILQLLLWHVTREQQQQQSRRQ